MVEGGVDLVPDGGDAPGQVDEGGDAAATRPGQPPVQGDLAGFALDGEDVAQGFFEQIGAVEAGVGLGDPVQFVALPLGEVVGVLPQRVAGVLESLGIAGGVAAPATVRSAGSTPATYAANVATSARYALIVLALSPRPAILTASHRSRDSSRVIELRFDTGQG